MNYLLPQHSMKVDVSAPMNALKSWQQGLSQQHNSEQQQNQFDQNMEFRQAQAGRAQANSDRSFALRKSNSDRNYKLSKHRASRGPKVSPNADLKREKLQLEISRLRDGDPLKKAKVRVLNSLVPPPTTGGATNSGSAAPSPQLQPQSNADGQMQPRLMSDTGQPQAGQDPNLIRVNGAQGQPAESGAPALSPEQQRAMALNLVSPGMGTAMMKKSAKQEAATRFAKPTINKVESQYLNADAAIVRMENIASKFNPKFLELDNRLGMAYLEARDKSGGIGRRLGVGLSKGERAKLTKYAKFRRAAAENINLYIKEITGAQMSEAEAKRLTLAQANAGQGLFDGDGPTTFKAKLDAALTAVRLSKARMVWLRQTGKIGANFRFQTDDGQGAPPPVSLDDMKQIMRKRRNDLLQDASIPEPQRRAVMMRTMRQEFGI